MFPVPDYRVGLRVCVQLLGPVGPRGPELERGARRLRGVQVLPGRAPGERVLRARAHQVSTGGARSGSRRVPLVLRAAAASVCSLRRQRQRAAFRRRSRGRAQRNR